MNFCLETISQPIYGFLFSNSSRITKWWEKWLCLSLLLWRWWLLNRCCCFWFWFWFWFSWKKKEKKSVSENECVKQNNALFLPEDTLCNSNIKACFSASIRICSRSFSSLSFSSISASISASFIIYIVIELVKQSSRFRSINDCIQAVDPWLYISLGDLSSLLYVACDLLALESWTVVAVLKTWFIFVWRGKVRKKEYFSVSELFTHKAWRYTNNAVSQFSRVDILWY